MQIIKGKGSTGAAHVRRILDILGDISLLNSTASPESGAFPFVLTPVNHSTIEGVPVFWFNYDLVSADTLQGPVPQQLLSHLLPTIAHGFAYEAGQPNLTTEQALVLYSPLREVTPENEALYEFPGQQVVGQRLYNVVTNTYGNPYVIEPGSLEYPPLPDDNIIVNEYGPISPIEP